MMSFSMANVIDPPVPVGLPAACAGALWVAGALETLVALVGVCAGPLHAAIKPTAPTPNKRVRNSRRVFIGLALPSGSAIAASIELDRPFVKVRRRAHRAQSDRPDTVPAR